MEVCYTVLLCMSANNTYTDGTRAPKYTQHCWKGPQDKKLGKNILSDFGYCIFP